MSPLEITLLYPLDWGFNWQISWIWHYGYPSGKALLKEWQPWMLISFLYFPLIKCFCPCDVCVSYHQQFNLIKGNISIALVHSDFKNGHHIMLILMLIGELQLFFYITQYCPFSLFLSVCLSLWQCFFSTSIVCL